MRIRSHLFIVVAVLTAILSLTIDAYAQKGPETKLTQLPQDHDYQRTLYRFMASLAEKDFAHGVTRPIPLDKTTSNDPEYLYRQYIMTMMHQPLIGNKRGVPAVTAPAKTFMLSAIETGKPITPPLVWPETLIPFVHWDYPGNLYRDNRALKLRAFVGAAVQIMMFHDFAEQNDQKIPLLIRPDWHGYQLIYIAAGYPGFKDVLPADVQKAFEAGLRMIGERVLGWGIRGESCANDMMGPVGLIYISRILGDPVFAGKVEAHTHQLFTASRLHPAGYWIERGGIDTGFGGTANFFAVWAALMTDWPFVKDALGRIYRLRAHLILPDPDGAETGPSHFNSRLGSHSAIDQWKWDGAREAAAAMITDEAVHCVSTPPLEELRLAPGKRAHHFEEDIRETPRDAKGRHIRPDEIANLYPWKLRMFMTYNFPASINPGYEFYRKGAFAHRQDLEKKNSPLLKSPFQRGENFVRDFEKAFVVTRQPAFAAILHTGTIGDQQAGDRQFAGPMGLSGGQLSAFWTPSTGSVLLGRRNWMSAEKSLDVIEAWRTWPNHSVSGVTADGIFFTSARIRQPATTISSDGARAAVRVAGIIPVSVVGQKESIKGVYEYARSFKIDDHSIAVDTAVKGNGAEQLSELYEVLPVYLREFRIQPKETPTKIEFQIGASWMPATDRFADKVRAVRLTRFKGAVVITFDTPRRVKLSPGDWQDTGFSRAHCRNVLVDLLESADRPTALTTEKKVAYRIEAAAK